MKKIKQIIQNSAGFTLAEMLLAILILLMVSTIVATGIPSAKNAYEKVVLASNAEVLLSTTMSELRNELGTARDVKRDDNVITYRNSYTGSLSKIFKNKDSKDDRDNTENTDPTGTIMLQRYAKESGIKDGSTPLRLVSKKASDSLYVTYDTVNYNLTTGIVTFRNLWVMRESSVTPLAKMDAFSVRVFSADKNS